MGGKSNLVQVGQMDSQNMQNNNDIVFLWRLWNR